MYFHKSALKRMYKALYKCSVLLLLLLLCFLMSGVRMLQNQYYNCGLLHLLESCRGGGGKCRSGKKTFPIALSSSLLKYDSTSKLNQQHFTSIHNYMQVHAKHD